VLVGTDVIARYQAAVNLIGLSSRQELTSASVLSIACETPKNDTVVNMTISFNEIEVYSGAAITSFSYDKNMLPDTDYTLKVTITTQNGLTDSVTKRVICR